MPFRRNTNHQSSCRKSLTDEASGRFTAIVHHPRPPRPEQSIASITRHRSAAPASSRTIVQAAAPWPHHAREFAVHSGSLRIMHILSLICGFFAVF